MRRVRRSGSAGLALILAALPGAAPAREVLGVFGRWGAFRDDGREARCFAIAEPVDVRRDGAAWSPFAAIGFWPRQGVRGQVNFRLSLSLQQGAVVTLSLGGQRFTLGGRGADVWAKDRQDDAAIVAALRAGGAMSIHGRTQTGQIFTDHYELRGAATALDAAALGCARG